jgi:predicted SnoaL-like aldol condensation-catalyzing enzyme
MNRYLGLSVLVGLLLSGMAVVSAKDGGRAEYNVKIGRRVFSEIYGAGKVDLVDELYAPDFVDDSPGGGTGRDLIKEAVTEFHRAVPDLKIEFEDVFATDDKVVLRYVATGTQTGPYGEIPASGQP